MKTALGGLTNSVSFGNCTTGLSGLVKQFNVRFAMGIAGINKKF
jgi:hypothetical protein